MAFLITVSAHTSALRQSRRDFQRTPRCCLERTRQPVLRVCNGPTCSLDGGSAALMATLRALLPDADIAMCGCLGGCGSGPNVAVRGRVASGAGAALRAGQIRPRQETVRAMQLKGEADVELSRGRAACAAMKYDDALRILRHNADDESIAGLSARIRANRSRALLEEGQTEEAGLEAHIAVKEDPMLAAAWLREAQAAWATGDLSRADEALRIGRELDDGVMKRFEEWTRKRKRKRIWGRIWGK